MAWSSAAGPWADLRARFRDASAFRSWVIDANDGIIATAGLLLGFAGAGASRRVLLVTATAATLAGGLSVAGAAWAEEAAERDAQLVYAQREQENLTRDPHGELEEFGAPLGGTGSCGPRPHARSPASSAPTIRSLAQLEWEYDFDQPMPATYPIAFGVGAGLAYVVGALVPLLITSFAPVDVEPWAIVGAVVVTLLLSSILAAQAGHVMPRRMLVRTLTVGILTLAVSYAAGELLL